MRGFLVICALLALAGCGIDGPPSPPEGSAQATGEARIGVVGAL
ncbi:MAG: hypothetical protein AAF230_11170 [Pseudomonadota bacterium]